MPPDPTLIQLGSAFAERRDELVENIVRRTKSELPEYAGVPAEELRDRTAAEVRHLIGILLEGRLFTPEDVLATDALTAIRAQQGVTREAIARATQIWGEEARAVYVEIIRSPELRDANLTDYMLAGWDAVDHVAVRSAEEIGAIQAELEDESEARRSDFVAAAFHGRLTGAALEARAAALDLDPEREYVVVRARTPAPETDRLRRALLRTQQTVGSKLVTTLDGDVVALLPALPPLQVDAPCGVGPAVRPSSLRESLLAATEALETAWAFGHRGYRTLGDLGVLPAILASPQLGRRLAGRYLAPLAAAGPTGDTLLETVDAYLANGMRMEQTAAALHVHVNTLRKRLERFKELTGADVRRAEDLVGIWWALRERERTRARRT